MRKREAWSEFCKLLPEVRPAKIVVYCPKADVKKAMRLWDFLIEALPIDDAAECVVQPYEESSD